MPVETHHWPQLTLDYRCHAPAGRIGRRLPPKFAACVSKIAGMTPEGVRSQYLSQVPDTTDRPVAALAARLHAVAKTLSEFGFEEALRRTPMLNISGVAYPPEAVDPPPCCKVDRDPATPKMCVRGMRCAHMRAPILCQRVGRVFSCLMSSFELKQWV